MQLNNSILKQNMTTLRLKKSIGRSPLRLALLLIPLVLGSVAFAQQPQDDPPCPTSTLAPDGLAPEAGGHCAGTGCLVKFNNYKWWTAFTYDPDHGYYYNGGLGTTFAPQHVV